jgi:hypothetical protein
LPRAAPKQLPPAGPAKVVEPTTEEELNDAIPFN